MPRSTHITRRAALRLLAAGVAGHALMSVGRAEDPATPFSGMATPVSGDSSVGAPAGVIARSIRQGEISSAEITRAYLQRIAELNAELNAIVRLEAEQAIDAAVRADAALAKGGEVGPLHGVPMTLKDSIDTAGVTTTYGTLGRRAFVPTRDATVAARLKAAGAVLLGKTNTPEFTLSFETDNLVYGRTSNPFALDRSPGGSSGGAAAAVAASLCAFDIGSDTGGSIRVPSHCCGTAGLKPTQGRVPRTGHAIAYGGLHDGLTQLGPIARSVNDLELILRVIAGPDGRDPFVVPASLQDSRDVDVGKLRIGWHADNGIYTPTTEIQAVTAAAAESLAKAGAATREVVPTPIPSTNEELLALFVWNADGGAWIQRLLDAAGTDTPHPAIAAQISAEYMVDGAEMTRLMAARDQFRAGMLLFMQDYDALITPVAGFPAPLFGSAEDDALFPGYSYTQVYNLSGQPAVVVRCGTSPEGLPIGVQIAARPWREDVALAVARRLEEEFGGWRAPPA